MSDQDDALAALETSGALDAIAWAFEWAFWRVNKDYDSAAGHGQAVVGVLAYTYAVDLFNRLAAGGRYRLPAGESMERGLDVLQEGIAVEAYRAMRALDCGGIRRVDFAGSPGWVVGDFRWILQSMPFGGVDKINWAEKSETKQRAGRQVFFHGNPGLFKLDDYGLDTDVDLAFEGRTLVVAHGFNGETGEYQVFIGQSRAADQQGTGPWHWRTLVASGGFGPLDPSGRLVGPHQPGLPPLLEAPDVVVRFRARPELEKDAT